MRIKYAAKMTRRRRREGARHPILATVDMTRAEKSSLRARRIEVNVRLRANAESKAAGLTLPDE